jgi:hypothetical protein
VLLSLTVLPLLLTADDPRWGVLAVIPAALFFVVERRTAVPVFTHRPVSLAANAASLAAGAAFLGAEVYLPLQIQVGFGESIAVVAVALVVATVGWTAGSMTAARFDASPGDQILLGTSIVFVGTVAMALPFGGSVLPILGYGASGIGMGIASPALFMAVLQDGVPGREGRSTSSVPLSRQVGAGLGTAVVGIVFALSLSDAAIRASEKDGAHVTAVIDAARHTYLAAAALGAIGVIACWWLRRSPRGAVDVAPDQLAA